MEPNEASTELDNDSSPPANDGPNVTRVHIKDADHLIASLKELTEKHGPIRGIR